MFGDLLTFHCGRLKNEDYVMCKERDKLIFCGENVEEGFWQAFMGMNKRFKTVMKQRM